MTGSVLRLVLLVALSQGFAACAQSSALPGQGRGGAQEAKDEEPVANDRADVQEVYAYPSPKNESNPAPEQESK